jgi:3-methylfumaryl-CoA hydratase
MAENEWSGWIGRIEKLHDLADPKPVRALAATFDMLPHDKEGDPLPYLSHWLYFLPMAPESQIGLDGHPKRDGSGFLPPVPIERRMWAGGRLTFRSELRVGDALGKTSEILKIAEKEGATGRMAFVTVKHEIASSRGAAIEEEQDIVYLDMPKTFTPPKPVPLPEDLAWQERYPVDPVLLFRFSAITFNGHRIHYDIRYATEVEKYPGLVVHGPLQAMLLMKAATERNAGRRPARFSFRGVRPAFDFDTVLLSGKTRDDGGLDLYTSNGDGHVCMQASISWQD